MPNSALLRLAGLLLTLSCKPAPGSSCDAGEVRCLDGKRALVCEDGRLVETPCKGKSGCLTVQEATSCDISGNQPGDACVKADEGAAVCVARDAMLACRGGKFERVPCRGHKGCEMVGNQASCDQSRADLGDGCNKPDATACSSDELAVLSCRDGAMRILYACRGERGCTAAGGKLSCDQTVAKLGDACDKLLDGHVACSDDRKGLIVCDGDRFVASEKCKPGTTCAVAGQGTACVRP